MGALRKLLACSVLSGVAAPAIVGRKDHAMNREDYLHDVASNPSRYHGRENEVDLATLSKEFRTLTEGMKQRNTEIVEAVKKANEQIASNGQIAQQTRDDLKKLGEDATALAARMQEVEQKLVAHNDNQVERRNAQKSAGAVVIEDARFKKWQEERGGKVRFGMKAITTASTGSGGAGDLIMPTRVSEIIRPEDRPMTIRALLASGQTASNSIEYVQETGFENNAAPVAEGNLKPESEIEFQLRTVPVRTIAHWMQASKQVLDDAPMLRSYIDGRLRFGLQIVEENQILSGDGTGQNLLGLIPEATAYNRPLSETRIDVIRRAMTQVRLSEYRADGVVLNPIDWEEIELTKTTEGAYVWANPQGLLGPTIWGLRVVDTTAIAADTFLVGAFRLAATVWDREEASVELSTEDRDNFIRNMVTIRAEERLALTVWRPAALVTGDFEGNISG